ncbi:MAG: hypothetical protein PHS14_20000 [Elusimicrobia bacterium]|nr:hypothetical protein [Elusimicrobiota bacterium]
MAIQGASLRFTDGGTRARLRDLQQRYNPTAVLSVIGRRIVNTEIPRVFAAGGPGWPAPRRGGDPMRDRGLLGKSFVWRLEGTKKLIIGSPHPGAHTLNVGAPPVRILPKKGDWLTIPFSPNLSTAERLTFNLRLFPNVVFLPKRGRLYAISRSGKGDKGRLVAVLVRGIGGDGEPQIKKREFLSWRLYGKSALNAADRYLRRLED